MALHATGARLLSGGSREIHRPVRLPGLPLVDGKRLLPGGPVGVDYGPDEADLDRLPLVRVNSVEFTPTIAESPGERRKEAAGRIARPMQGPLLARRIEQAQRQPGESLGGKRDFVEVAGSTENRPDHAMRRELFPLVGTGQRLQQAAVSNRPGAKQEIEVLRAIRSVIHVCSPGFRAFGLTIQPRLGWRMKLIAIRAEVRPVIRMAFGMCNAAADRLSRPP